MFYRIDNIPCSILEHYPHSNCDPYTMDKKRNAQIKYNFNVFNKMTQN